MVRVLKTFLVALFPGSSRKGSGELLFSDLGDCGGALFLVNALYHSVFVVIRGPGASWRLWFVQKSSSLLSYYKRWCVNRFGSSRKENTK